MLEAGRSSFFAATRSWCLSRRVMVQREYSIRGRSEPREDIGGRVQSTKGCFLNSVVWRSSVPDTLEPRWRFDSTSCFFAMCRPCVRDVHLAQFTFLQATMVLALIVAEFRPAQPAFTLVTSRLSCMCWKESRRMKTCSFSASTPW